MLGELTILNSSKKIIARISPSFYFDYKYHTYLETGAETLDFSVQLDDKMEQILRERNYILFKRNNKYKMFQIMTCKDEESYDSVIRTIESETIGLELLNDFVRELKIEGNMSSILKIILQDTNYKVGYVSEELDDMISYFEVSEPTSVYTVLQNLVPKFNSCELEFEVKCEDTIKGDYELLVNCYANGERGNKTYKRFDYDFNTYGMSRTGDATEFCSGLIAVGANGITFKDIDWEEGDNNAPLSKPKGQDFLIDPEAHAMIGGGDKYILCKYKSEATTPIDLLWDTYYKLQEVKQIKYKYEIPINLTDAEYDDIDIGDTCYIVNDKFSPPIQLEARINELELSDNGNKATFANYKEVKSNLKKSWTPDDIVKDAISELGKMGALTQADIEWILEQIRQLGLQSDEMEEALKNHNKRKNNNKDDDIRVKIIDGGLWIGDKRIYDLKKYKVAEIKPDDPKEPSNPEEPPEESDPKEPTKPDDPKEPDKKSKDYAAAVKYYAKFNLGTRANDSSLAKVRSSSNKYKIPVMVKYWSRKFGLDPDLVYCLIMAESSGSPYCATKSSAGGYGLMQCEREAYFNKKQTVKFLDGSTKSFTPSYSTMKPYAAGNITIDGVSVDKNISNQIMFGCHEFRKSLERFQYNIFASLVGYNFGLYGCDLCICKYVAEKNGLSWVNKYGYTAQSKKVQELYFKELKKLTCDWANERKWYKQNKKAGTPNNIELYLRWYKSKDGQLPYVLDKDGVKHGYGAYKPSTSKMSTNTTASAAVKSSSSKKKYVNASSLNVRSGPGTSYSKVGALSEGAVVEIISEQNGWAKINYKDGTAYVSSKYLVSYKTPGTDYDGKVATDVRKKIVKMAKTIVSDHVDKKKATYNQDPRTTRYEKPRIWYGTHYGIKNPVAYDCSSFVGCCYHYAGIDDLIGLSCCLGSLVAAATKKSGYKMWKVTSSGIKDAIPGDIVMDANFTVTSSNLNRSTMIKEGKTHHTMIYIGDGKVAHASQWEYHPKAIKISNISYYTNKGTAFFLRPYQLAKLDEESKPIKEPTKPPVGEDPGDDPGTEEPVPEKPKPITPIPTVITMKGLDGAGPNHFYNETRLVQDVIIGDSKDDTPYPLDPPYVFCQFGIKNLGEDNISYYKDLLKALNSKYPNTPIFVSKEYHVPTTYANYAEVNANIDAFNAAMLDFALDTRYIIFLDATSGILDNGCLKSGLTTDGFALKDKASYEKYYDSCKEAILKYNNKDYTPVDVPQDPTAQDPTDGKPIINGVANKEITVGDSFDPLSGVTAKDKDGVDLTSKIIVSGKVNNKTAGNYMLTYSVTDSNRNTRTVYCYITVNAGDEDTTPPKDDPGTKKPAKKVKKSIIMKSQQTYSYKTVDEMIFKLPSSLSQNFFSKLIFTTPKSNPKFSQSKIVYMTGDHCKNGALLVKPSYQYTIIVYANPDSSQSKYAASVAAYKKGGSEEKFKNFKGAKDIPIIAANWLENKSKFQYGTKTPLSFSNPDANKSKWKIDGKYNIDCSTLAGLIMRGHKYTTSPYAKKTTKLKKNPKYAWAFNLPRTAAEQAKYCVDNGWVLNGIDMTDFSNVPVGALIFYDRDGKLNDRFMACSHVAICIGKDKNGVNQLIESTTVDCGIRTKAIKDNTPDKILFIALPKIF